MDILYFDDVQHDLDFYSGVLESKLTASVIRKAPPPDLSLKGLPQQVDIVLIDYELSRKDRNGKPAPYRGGTLASRLAEVYPESPLVVLSRPSIFRKLNVTSENLSAVDDWIFKEDLATDDIVLKRIRSLVDGFRKLKQSEKKDWKSLVGAMKATVNEEDLLKASGPPLRSGASEGTSNWTVHEAARWIRKVVLAYPGILYDATYAAASLGITKDSFQDDNLQSLFTHAKYVGLFCDEDPRWWRGRIFEIAQQIISKAGLDRPTATVFADAYMKEYGGKLSASRCVFSGEPNADTVCYILGKPAKREYTLEYRPDNRPSVMESARVSFKAIRESNEFNEDFLPASSKSLVNRIRK